MKRSLIIMGIVLAGLAVWYGMNEWNRKNPDLSEAAASETTTAESLIAAFEQDTASASGKFTDKVVQVSGTLKKMARDERPLILFLGNANTMSSVVCSMDSAHAAGYASLKEGAAVTVKGMCVGYQFDDLLGTDVRLNRCVVVTNTSPGKSD
jgi:hypothetical protein